MDILERVWPSLDAQKRRLVEDMALALAGVSPEPEPEYMTIAQASKRFGRSTSALYKAIAEERIPHTTPNGQKKPIFIKSSDVREWLGWKES